MNYNQYKEVIDKIITAAITYIFHEWVTEIPTDEEFKKIVGQFMKQNSFINNLDLNKKNILGLILFNALKNTFDNPEAKAKFKNKGKRIK